MDPPAPNSEFFPAFFPAPGKNSHLLSLARASRSPPFRLGQRINLTIRSRVVSGFPSEFVRKMAPFRVRRPTILHKIP